MIRALAGLFLAAFTRPLRETHAELIGFIVRHLTILSITQLVQYLPDLRDTDQTDSVQPGKDQDSNILGSKSTITSVYQTRLLEPGLNLALPIVSSC